MEKRLPLLSGTADPACPHKPWLMNWICRQRPYVRPNIESPRGSESDLKTNNFQNSCHDQSKFLLIEMRALPLLGSQAQLGKEHKRSIDLRGINRALFVCQLAEENLEKKDCAGESEGGPE